MRNTSATSEGNLDPTKQFHQKKELEEQRSARFASKSKKEASQKPITASKNEKTDGKAPSTSKYMSKSTPVLSVDAAEAKSQEAGAKSLDVSIDHFVLNLYTIRFCLYMF